MPAKSMNELYDYALTFFRAPYTWGGEGPLSYDCSGFVQRVLAYGGVDPKGDQSASSLYSHFVKEGTVNMPGMGALAFFGSQDRIHHVGWCIDKKIMINASGGGSHVKSIQIAKQLGAYVAIEPINYRKDLVAIIMPFYQLPAS